MSGGQMMVVLIIAIVMIASIVKARYRGSRPESGSGNQAIETAETMRLREEVKGLKERIAVLERIATDRNHSLEAEFERLRREE